MPTRNWATTFLQFHLHFYLSLSLRIFRRLTGLKRCHHSTCNSFNKQKIKGQGWYGSNSFLWCVWDAVRSSIFRCTFSGLYRQTNHYTHLALSSGLRLTYRGRTPSRRCLLQTSLLPLSAPTYTCITRTCCLVSSFILNWTCIMCTV